jgi:hypothetical protein
MALASLCDTRRSADDPEGQLRAGTLFLLGGRRGHCRATTAAVLEKDPMNLDGLVLLAD